MLMETHSLLSLQKCVVDVADQIRHIATVRHPIPDVPVLYFIEPLPANLKTITSDLSRGLYSPAYINFLSSIPRPLLEDFAAQTAAAGTSESIAQVFDQYLNFIVGEPDLFSLGMRKENTYWALNSARTKDEELDHVVDKVVSGLFSVVVTMGSSHMGLAILCYN
jgi:sec1 family domain-containing protein 1